ncbi:MAG: DUF3368 domain-containing protein [Verrucomicrobia bacterium]|nr:DUF3368 domain-containing protein [Verrucomicrobiota bacterium]
MELLRDLFGSVLVAEEVKAEVEAGGGAAAGADMFSTTPWLQVKSLSHQVDPWLTSMLDQGEAATISLANQVSASLVLMDERKGRNIARKVYGIAVIGTGRLLVEAKRAALIRNVRPALEQMRASGYWLADNIVAEILRQAGE